MTYRLTPEQRGTLEKPWVCYNIEQDAPSGWRFVAMFYQRKKARRALGLLDAAERQRVKVGGV